MARARQDTDWRIEGVVDAHQLAQHVAHSNAPAVLGLMSTLELARTWSTALAEHLVQRAADLGIPASDVRFLEKLVGLDSKREGAVRFSVVDLVWRRRVRPLFLHLQ